MSTFKLGIQVAPQFILGEGIEESLDFLQANGVDALHLNSHTYYGGGEVATQDNLAKVKKTWPDDHPEFKSCTEMNGRAWVQHDPAAFKACGLFHRYPENDDTDYFRQILDAAHARGMQVHARYLDGWEISRGHIPGWTDIQCRTLSGTHLDIPCFSQQRVHEWTKATMADMATHYEVDGLFYGIERGTVLSDIMSFGHKEPYCQCSACEHVAQEHNVDFQRLHQGLGDMVVLIAAARKKERQQCSYLSMFLKILMDYPEIMAWERIQNEMKDSIEVEAIQAFKAVRPEASSSVLVHQESCPIKSMHEDWALHAHHADAVALRLYEHVLGPRLVHGVRTGHAEGIFGDLSESALTELIWHLSGGLPEHRRSPDELFSDGCPPERAIDRAQTCVDLCGNDAAVQVALGVDISYPFKERRETPVEYIQEIIRGVQAQGVKSIILCREYQEISGRSMRAAADSLM
ncbi:MAG: hypothetical protein HRU15_16600 [Planctomycetes bacterium]|nr:hypothetical protein [Planctomycetota bacterium]